jgi:hypothetical protein
MPTPNGQLSRRQFELPNERVRLHCPLTLWNPRDGTVTRTTTEEVSWHGFSCLCNESFLPGDELVATLEIGRGSSGGDRAVSLILHCNVGVVDVARNPDFGISCHINNYVVFDAPGSGDPENL